MDRRCNQMRKKRIKTKQDAIDLVQEQHRLHKEKWLTWEVAEKYHRRACALKMPTNEIKGETRELMLELMREYGVTQLEAVNILQGYHIADYVNKYYRIQNLIPLDIKEKKANKKDEEGENE